MKQSLHSSWHDVSTTLAMTVGSPSAHRRGTMLKHVAFLLLFLFSFGVGNVWGGKYTINYGDSFSPALPTASSSVNSTSTAHTVSGLAIKEQGIYKGSSNNYLMFVSGKGFLYNTSNLVTVTSVAATYSSGTSTSGKTGVYFGTSEKSTYTTSSNATIKGISQTDTWTNSTAGNGYFQLSTSNKNVQITQIVVTCWTKVTLDKNGGTADGIAYYDDNAAAASTATGYTFSAASRTGSYTCTGYYTAASGGTKVLNANGTFANANVSGYITSSKWTYAGATLKLYAQWEAVAVSCETNPTVGNIMNAVSSITSTGATFSTSTGVSAGTNCSLEEVGFVYGTSANPTTTSGTKATITSYTSGALNKSVTGLEPNTTYYVRAYAINGHGTTYSDEKSFSTPELPKYTVSFVTGAGNSTQANITEASANAGITLPAGPSTIKCSADGWSFAGWSETNVASETTTTPTILPTGNYKPTSDITLYAVYTRTIGGSGGAPVGTTMYAENFSGFAADDVPSSTKTGNPTVYGGGSVTYTSEDNGTNKTKIYDEKTVGDAKPELLIGKNGGVFTVAGIPAGKATTLTLSYKRNNALTPTVTGTGVSIGSVSNSDGVYTATITCTNQATVFSLIFTAGSSNVRFDDVSVVVASTTAAGTAYYLSAPDCCTELGTINGPVTLSQLTSGDNAGKLQATWPSQTTTTGWAANGIQIKIYEDGNATPVVTSSALANSTTSFTATGFTPKTCTQYYATLTAIHGDDASYCAGNLISDPSAKVTTAGYTYTVTLTDNHVTKSGGTVPATTCGGSVEATYQAVSGWVLPTSITVTNAGDENDGWSWEVSDGVGTLTILDSEVTSDVVATITATAAPCAPMSAPSVTVTPTYNGASLSWDAVTHASKYKVYIYNNDDSSVESDENVATTSYMVSATLANLTTYKYRVDAVSEDESSYCSSYVTSNFTTLDYPTVKLFYSENGVLSEGVDKKILTDFTLPTTAEECDKTFIGWTTSANASYSHASVAPDPFMGKGATYQIPTNANCTLYAVYANVVEASTYWTRVTAVKTLTDGGTFIMGYEDEAKSGVIVPLRSADSNATTSANGYFNTGTSNTASGSGTITMSSVTSTSDYEVYISASSTTGYINIQQTNSSGNFYGATSGGTTSNKARLYTSGNSNETNILPEWASETNNQFKLKANVSGDYKYLKYNTNSPRFAFYNSAGEKVVFYKKNVIEASTTNYATTCKGKVVKPVISGVTDGTTYESAQTITITSATPSATIHYTTDGSAPTTSSPTYSAPFELSANGDYTIRAIAVKTDMTNSDEATPVSFTLDLPFTTIASFIAAEPTNKKLVFTGAKVLGVTTNYIYIQDATGGIQLNKSSHGLTFASGKTLSGYVVGTYSNNSNSAYMPRLTFTDGSTMGVTEDAAALPEATVITAGSEANICKLVKLQNVKFQSISLSSNTVYVQKSDLDIDTVYNTFGVLNQTLPNSATLCDVTGVLIKYSQKYEIAPVSVDGITTNGASAILPTLSTVGSTDSESPLAVAEGKVITVIPAAGMTTTLKDGDADATTITEATNVTISEDKAIVVTAQAYYYNNNTVNTATYYYHADGSLTERTISKATMSNGTVTVKNGDTEVSSAAQGATITLIPVPTFTTTQHYHLTNISVVDAEENDVELSGPTDGKYTFSMPAAAVTVSATFAEDAKYAITFDGNGNTGGTAPSAISNKYAGTEITLPACNYKKSGYSFSHWTVAETDSKNPVTVANNKFNMPAAAVTITAQWAALPVWATTYTSNITTVAESLVEAEDGEQYAAWKVASGSSITLDIPKGTTAIHMHMVAWNKEAANATISGTCFTSNKVVALTADAGISGNSPFSLEDNEGSEYYFSFTPDNAINANTTITISAASSKRLVVFGVNAIYPEIKLSPASYNFENVRAGKNKTQEFTITTNANVSGTLSASIIDDANGKYSVTDIENGKVTVTFAPGGSESGTFTAKLKVWATNALVTADLTGTAIATAAPEITVDKTAIAFGRVDANANVSEDIAIGLLNIVGDVSAALSGTNADKFELSASSFSENGTLTITPKTTEQGVFAATLTLSATDVTPIEIPVSITVASKWATMYTSNVTPSGTGMESKKASINSTDYNAFKKAAANDVTITLPRGTQTLHLHMVAWNGENGNVTISGDCFSSAKVINVPAHTDVSGGKGTYTFTAAEAISYYHELVLDNVNNNSTTTVTVSMSGKRIILFGVNQEGGVIEITESTNISTLGDVENQPIVASGEGVVLTVNVPTTTPSITAKNGATIVIAETATADDVVVDENSKIELTATVTAPVFRICTAPGQQATSGQVTGVSHVAAESIIMDVQLLEAGDMDAAYWYSISAPFDVNVAGGFMTTGGRVLIHNVDFQIWSYAPDLYANGGRSWRRCADGVMHKNAAYLIGFDPDRFDNGIVPNVVRLKAAENTTLDDEVTTIEDLQTQTSATLKPGYAWNGVANPNVYHINVGRDVQLWDNYSHGFLPATVGNNGLLDHDSYSFVVGTPFFCKDDGTHSIAIAAATHGTEYTIPNEAPARNAAERYSFCVQIRKPGSRYYENRLYVRASEDALATFEDGKDMETLNETCNGHALIWTNAYGKRLAIEDAPLTNNQAMYDLTIMTPAAGTYVLRQASEVDGADLYVTYEGAIVWNLSLGDYELDLTKGTTTGYGLMLVVQPNQMPTGVEDGESLNGENGVQKILLNGNLYILRDGHLYDAVGKQAR